MTLYVKDPATSEAVRKLAKLKGVSLTEAIKVAVENALRQEDIEIRREKLDALVAEIAKRPNTGLEADKAFYDSLYED